MADSNQEQDNATPRANANANGDRPPAGGRPATGRARRIGGGPLTGVALAALFVVAVAIALAIVPPSTPAPSIGRQANAQAPLGSPAPTSATGMLRPPADIFITGTTAGAITISWRAPRPLPVGFRIYRATGRFAPYTIVGTVNEPDLTSFTDATDLTPAATYVYTVTSFDGQNESAPSGPVVAVLLPAPQPTATAATSGKPLAPLPTFAPIAPATLTAIARLPQPVGTPLAVPGASTTPGIVVPATSPTSSAAILTPVAGVPTVAPAPTLSVLTTATPVAPSVLTTATPAAPSALTTATPVAPAATLVPLPTRVSVGPAGVPTRHP